ncbi:MAG: tetratricopeptide repeat protein [Bacteroidales bacterium]|nr:tetratricopeptide repeat protein [Bacteroidales bacterium]
MEGLDILERNELIMKKYLCILFVSCVLIVSCSPKLLKSTSKIRVNYNNSAEYDFLYAEGLRLKLLGGLNEAINCFEKCLKYKPQSDAVYFQLAEIMIAKGNIEYAKELILKAEKINDKNLWYNLMLCDIYQKLSNYDSAIYFIEKSLKISPGNNEIQMKAAELYSITNNFKKAAEIFKQIEQRYGVNEKTGIILIENYIKAEDYDSAKNTLLKLIKLYPEKIFYKSMLADVYYKTGEKEKAFELYNSIIEIENNDAKTLQLIIGFLADEKEYSKLFNVIDEIIIRNDITIDDKIDCFKKILEKKQLIDDEFDKLEEKLIKLENEVPENKDINMLRVELYEKKGIESKLENRLIEIINKDYGNYEAWEKLLLFYASKNQWDKLFVYAAECSREFNLSYMAKILYANAAMEKGEYTIALQEIGKAKILAGNITEAIVQALIIEAEIYYRIKDYEKCFKTFEDILNKDPDNIIALNNYAYFLAEDNRNLDKALKMAEKVISREPENATYLDTYAWVLFKMGKVRKSIEVIEKILSNKDNNDAEYFEHYGFMLKGVNRCKDAIEVWRKAIEIDKSKTYLEEEIKNCSGKKK